MVIGGAYSVDKYYRLENDLLWFADEQPSAEIKTYVEDQITKNRIDIVLSHTCPYKYEPRDAFLPMIDQSTVDDSTERWLDGIEEKVDYKALMSSLVKRSIWLAMVTLYSVPKTSIFWLLEMF